MNTKHMKQFYIYLLLSLVPLLGLSSCETASVLHVSGSVENDLVSVLNKQNELEIRLYSSPQEALESAIEGEGLLVLSASYPEDKVSLTDKFYQTVVSKKLRAFIEYPDFVPGVEMGDTYEAQAERAVVRSGFFGTEVDSLQILGLNGLHFISNNADGGHLVAAKVAGFDSAIFGLPAKTTSLLFSWEDHPVLISTTNLSQFISGRFAPQKQWAHIWKSIIEYVSPQTSIGELEWTPTVSTTFSKNEDLPQDFQKLSIGRGIQWYKEAKMLVPGGYEDKLQKMLDKGDQRMAWDASIPYGDGSEGAFECIFSEIDENGSQPIGIIKRGDCISETAMAFATAGALFDKAEYLSISENLLDFYLLESIATKKEYGDPRHGAYGLIPWGISNQAWFKASYGDDNARFLLGALTSSALTGAEQWDRILMKSLVALIRTTGQNGFRGSRIDLANFEENGWRYYQDREILNLSPHFEAYLWACYLWAYDKTGDKIFLDKAKEGIHLMMEHYPDGWVWTNGLAQERARMILPLSWLVRVDDSRENKELLLRVTKDFLELQDECGAIREELGKLEMGKYPPPQSNEAYGTTEASLIARNGDPVSDLLYTTNFAFLGLHEAAYATKDPEIENAVDKLAAFLCRIQVRSDNHPELDGGWMRAFDYERFEHWGSNADHGWGAWAIETGWTQGWITTILALRELDTSIWDLTKNSKLAEYYPELKKEMLK
ncbi:hypothetical protein [Membranihabitans maritimus]|uniref:hypothetical protein n=1 Tax=Membranihabitans maritimus TaxID=2904244 RepID=UPI001F3064AE|nr:hypothetical protein [Membranihabitans maritimus]